MPQKINEEMRQQALRSDDDFSSIDEHREHIHLFAKDFATAIVTDTNPNKATDLAKEIEGVLDGYSISDAIFALAGVVEGAANSFKEDSNPTIIIAGFTMLVSYIHEQRVSEEKGGGNA